MKCRVVYSVALTLGALWLTACELKGPKNRTSGLSGPAREIQELESQPWGDPDAVVAEVNGRPVSRGEFYVRVLRRFGTWKLLTGVIKEELFLQEATRLGIKVTREEHEAKVDEILNGQAAEFPGGMTELARLYESEGLSMERVRRDLDREVGMQLLVGRVTMELRKIDDEQLRRYYDQTYRHKRYETRHIAYGYAPQEGGEVANLEALKLEAWNKATRAANRVRQGADFAAIARAESDDPVTADKGGRLGALHEGSPMPPDLKREIFALGEGDVSDPIENSRGVGYHVFQVTQVLPSESFVDCREKLRKDLLEREPDLKEIEATLNVLRDGSEVRIFGTPLMQLERSYGSRLDGGRDTG